MLCRCEYPWRAGEKDAFLGDGCLARGHGALSVNRWQHVGGSRAGAMALIERMDGGVSKDVKELCRWKMEAVECRHLTCWSSRG